MIRIGVDFGGSKIEAAALDPAGRFAARIRAPNPGGYEAALQTVRQLVKAAEAEAGPCARIGVGMPGSPSPRTGLVRNANSTWLNGRPFAEDLGLTLDRPVRLANDANCLALSESADGAAAGAGVAFAAILGTGCGAGVVVDGRLVEGANGIGGEWGHTPLPWATPEEAADADCWCGLSGCLETYLSGPGLERDYARVEGTHLTTLEIVEAARAGEPRTAAAIDRYIDRLARGLAVIANVIDPDVIVLGGGMSNIDALYPGLTERIARYAFSDLFETPVRPAMHGDSSGVRGAAWLWPLETR